MLHPVHKTPVIHVLVGPDEDAVGVLGLVVHKATDVDVAVDVLETVAVLAVVLEGALVEAGGRVAVD